MFGVLAGFGSAGERTDACHTTTRRSVQERRRFRRSSNRPIGRSEEHNDRREDAAFEPFRSSIPYGHTKESSFETSLVPVDRKFFDPAGGAEYLRGLGMRSATAKFVYTLMASGELPRVKISKAFYVSKRALDEWLVKRERRAR